MSDLFYEVVTVFQYRRSTLPVLTNMLANDQLKRSW